MGITHVAAGLVAAVLLNQSNPAVVVGIVAGSLLPDVDSPTSTIGRVIPVIPHLIKHRTITHSIWLALLAGLLWWPLGVGIALHILLDCLTTEGVPIFWPAKACVKVPAISKFIKTGGWFEGAFCGTCWGYLLLEVMLSLGL